MVGEARGGNYTNPSTLTSCMNVQLHTYTYVAVCIVAQILCMVNKSNPSVQAKSNLFYREDMEREQAKNISSIL